MTGVGPWAAARAGKNLCGVGGGIGARVTWGAKAAGWPRTSPQEACEHVSTVPRRRTGEWMGWTGWIGWLQWVVGLDGVDRMDGVAAVGGWGGRGGQDGWGGCSSASSGAVNGLSDLVCERVDWGGWMGAVLPDC